MTQALRDIMKTFAETHGLGPLKRGRDGTYTLLFDRQWVVNITDDPATGRIHLFSAPALASDTAAGPVLLDASADPALLDAIAFPLWLQSFVDQVAYWSDTPVECGCDAQEQDGHPIAPLPASPWLT
ncbi:MAG: hypothetical protein ACO1N5_10540 [Noviherbaspirillum sp.]